MQADQLDRIRRLFPCFTGIPQERWQAAEIMTVTPATPHSIREGHVLRHAVFILSGAVRIYKISPSGREVTLYRVRSGECCVLMMVSILGETAYEASADIETDTDVLLLPVPVFKDWMGAYPQVGRFVYQEIVRRITNVTTLLELIAFHSVPCRLADYLLSESAASPPDEAGMLHITHERLAVELGTAREVVSRTLKDFAARGAVTLSRGRIAIRNTGLLQQIAEPHL